MVIRLLMSALFLVSAAAAWGEAAVRVSVERTTVQVNQTFRIQVTVSGGRSDEPKFPKIDGLVIGPASETMSNLSIIQGVVTQSVGTVYTATATRAGKLVIPAITVKVDGKDVSSKPVELTVLEGKTPPPVSQPNSQRLDDQPQGQAQAGADATSNASPTEDDAVLITAEVDKRSVYEGEGIQLVLSRWVLRGVNAAPYRNADPGYPATEGFYSTELEPRQEERMKGTWPYHLVQLTQKLYPTRSGKLTIGQWQFNGHALMRTNRGNYKDKEYALTTAPIEVDVKPLPDRPANFSGAVGTFTFRPSLGSPVPKTVQQGVPFKLALEIQGDGNPDSIGEPKLAAPNGATVSKADTDPESKVDTTTGIVTKEFIYTILPLQAGKLSIPPIEFCYFDPATAKFKTETAGPFDMDVRPSSEKSGGSIVTAGAPVAQGKVNVIGKDILPNVDAPAGLHAHRASALGVGAVATVPVLAYAGFAIVMGRRRRFAQDTGYARAYFAKSKAHKRLQAVRSAPEPAEELYRAVSGFVADKFNVSDAGLTSSDLRAMLDANGVDTELSESITKIVRACERARYAAVKLSSDEIEALTHAASAALESLEQTAKENRA